LGARDSVDEEVVVTATKSVGDAQGPRPDRKTMAQNRKLMRAARARAAEKGVAFVGSAVATGAIAMPTIYQVSEFTGKAIG
jgi:hypothetical protein